MSCAAGLLSLLRRGRWGAGETDLEAERVKLPHEPIGLALGARRRRGQPPVFDMPVQHNGFLAAGAGDWRRSGEGFQAAGVGEPCAVVADLGQHPGAGQVAQAGESW